MRAIFVKGLHTQSCFLSKEKFLVEINCFVVHVKRELFGIILSNAA